MAIDPGADLLADALAAADPQRAKAAADRLARLAAGNGDDTALAPEFQAVLAASGVALHNPAILAATFAGTAHSVQTANPYEQFEATVLKSLFEFMLPAKAPSVFGSGLAGDVWKSMLADALAGQAGQAGIAGIARSLKARNDAGTNG